MKVDHCSWPKVAAPKKEWLPHFRLQQALEDVRSREKSGYWTHAFVDGGKESWLMDGEVNEDVLGILAVVGDAPSWMLRARR